MSNVSNALFWGVAGGLAAKGIHIAIAESCKDSEIPEVARNLQKNHAGYSTPFKVMNIFEHVILIPLGEEGLFRALPAALFPHPLVNFGIAPTIFGFMHYDPEQKSSNMPYVLSQIASGVLFSVLLKEKGFSAVFTAHAVSNLYTVCSLLI